MSILSNSKTRAAWIAGVLAVGAIGLGTTLYATGGRARPDEMSPLVDRLPTIRPDYSGTVLPPNIAPPNFLVAEQAQDCFVRIHADQGDPIEVFGKGNKIIIPQGPWHALTAANRGGTLNFDVFVRPGQQASQWQRFQTMVTTIAAEDIDDYVVYRRILPGQATWRKVGVYQRSLHLYGILEAFRARQLQRAHQCRFRPCTHTRPQSTHR